MSNKKPLVINLFAGPGAGKSTIAAEIFALLKWAGVKVELVREFAKEELWAGHEKSFQNQLYISGVQSQRQSELRDQVDVIVTDSPIILGCLYGASLELSQELLRGFNSYDNLNIFLKRTKPYESSGRHQTEEEAKEIDRKTLDLLLHCTSSFVVVTADCYAAQHIVKGAFPNA